MNIETYGVGERMRYLTSYARDITGSHLVLLPVPTTKDKKHITGTEIPLSDTLLNVKEGSIVFGYGLPDEYKKEVKGLGGKIFDLSLDEEFLKENAHITAIGAVGYLLTNIKSMPEQLRVGVMGYGRIGSELVKLLLFLGAKVKVYTSKVLTRIDLGSCGVDSVSVSEWDGCVHDFSGLDILINTAPKDMRECFPDGKIKNGMRIIELASGENFKGIAEIERLPGIPDKMYPASAAKAYVSAIRRAL